ncbi:MAG: hypothetical protein ABIL49_06300 [candidate division WOR-3 bacterium]|jgi:hypothetical protein
MRNFFYKISLPLIFLALSFCGKKSTEPTTQPPYSVKVGDAWIMQREISGNIDTTKLVVVAETLINNIRFYEIVDTLENSEFYINASDSIIVAFFMDQTPVIFRLIRANVNQGDSWVDSTVLSNGTIVKVLSTVDSVNVSETVPAGSFIVNKMTHKFRVKFGNIDTLAFIFKSSINRNVIFVRMTDINNTTNPPTQRDLKLIRYIKAQ